MILSWLLDHILNPSLISWCGLAFSHRRDGSLMVSSFSGYRWLRSPRLRLGSLALLQVCVFDSSFADHLLVFSLFAPSRPPLTSPSGSVRCGRRRSFSHSLLIQKERRKNYVPCPGRFRLRRLRFGSCDLVSLSIPSMYNSQC